MDYSRRLSWMLVLTGVAGLFVAVAMMPFGLFAFGVTFRSPIVYGIFAQGYAPFVMAMLSALLFIAGRRRDYVGSALGAALVIIYNVANWRIQILVAESGKVGPLAALVMATALGTAVISVLALMSARALRSGGALDAQDAAVSLGESDPLID